MQILGFGGVGGVRSGGDTIAGGGGVWGSGDRAHIYIYICKPYANNYIYICKPNLQPFKVHEEAICNPICKRLQGGGSRDAAWWDCGEATRQGLRQSLVGACAAVRLEGKTNEKLMGNQWEIHGFKMIWCNNFNLTISNKRFDKIWGYAMGFSYGSNAHFALIQSW